MSLPVVPEIEVPDLSGLARVSHSDLMSGMREWAAHVRSAEKVVAAFAGELDRRSGRDAGYEGLAASTGARGPEGLVSHLTGRSSRDARDLVTVGRMMDAPPVWLTDVASGVADGTVSVGAAAAITIGLGAPSESVGADDLLDAAQKLAAEAGLLPPEKVARRARELRDEMDAAGVADREAHLRTKRFLHLTPQPDGMTRIFGMLDPESAALVTDAIDCVTAPRRHGPRFVDPDEVARAKAIESDPRTTDQLALDALVDMIRIDAGHARRLFTERQRVALAAIWGGCAHPDCDRPPSWTEAHHAQPHSHGGPTTVANGILLCRFHHMLVHNQGWTVSPPDRTGGQWKMLPPPGSTGRPVNLVSKSPLRRNR